MNQETSTSYLPLLLTFLAGAAVGGVVVALSTPKSGPALRGDLKDLAILAKLKAAGLADDAGVAWDGMKERTALAATDLKRGVTDAANDLRG
jgi:gas vesicle protein